MKTDLSHKELVKLGRYESDKGRSLSQIEGDFLKMDVGNGDTLQALKEIDYLNKKDALKAEREAEAKKPESEKTAPDAKTNPESGTENKSSFWAYFFVFLVLVGLALYYYLYNNKF